jgi:hypothetical protein
VYRINATKLIYGVGVGRGQNGRDKQDLSLFETSLRSFMGA